MEYDYEFAGGSVLQLSGHVLTASAPYLVEVEGASKACAKIRVDDGERQRFFIGDLINLGENGSLQVVGIEVPESKSGKGRILLRIVD